jgi:hypothetical protein
MRVAYVEMCGPVVRVGRSLGALKRPVIKARRWLY